MRETMRFLRQALALAMAGYWASEALFWGFPPVPRDPVTLGVTVLVYAAVFAAVLAAAQVTGAAGFPGLVLSGALFGFLIEGVVVDTMIWGVPVTLVCDNMAGYLMARGEVQSVIVGADRIARNGDVANKIGTYGLAVLARAHDIPFFVAAPRSTLDLSLKGGAEIPIEERSADEVTSLGGVRIAPLGVHARHPAFDVTPARLITAIITDVGVARAPFEESLAGLPK